MALRHGSRCSIGLLLHSVPLSEGAAKRGGHPEARAWVVHTVTMRPTIEW